MVTVECRALVTVTAGRLLGGSREGQGPGGCWEGPTGVEVLPGSPMDLWGLSDVPDEPVGLTYPGLTALGYESGVSRGVFLPGPSPWTPKPQLLPSAPR